MSVIFFHCAKLEQAIYSESNALSYILQRLFYKRYYRTFVKPNTAQGRWPRSRENSSYLAKSEGSLMHLPTPEFSVSVRGLLE
ncbi:hypothetical protein [Alteromonas macleodii]|uniref:hypothetical protein n=1 Tax=Alteromonas macleodii TaxID=28108 RepID=UPI0011A4B112|nr:hypothetical protein [Alteromonas macleodii]